MDIPGAITSVYSPGVDEWYRRKVLVPGDGRWGRLDVTRVPLVGHRHLGADGDEPMPGPVLLVPDEGNASDPNAMLCYSGGRPVAYVAREHAALLRGLAGGLAQTPSWGDLPKVVNGAHGLYLIRERTAVSGA